MVKLDSVKVKVSEGCISDRKKLADIPNYCAEKTVTDGGNVTSWEYFLKDEYKPYGLKSMVFKPMEDAFILELSSKILLEEYSKLLNIDTFERAIDIINENKVAQFNPNLFLEEGLFLRVDATSNLHVERDIQEYVRALSLLKSNPRYLMNTYRSESIVFRNKAKSYRERVIFYDKYKEILKDGKLLAHLSPQEIRAYRNILRVERNISSFKSMRETFHVDENTIRNILLSKSNPNLELYQKLKIQQPSLFAEYDESWKLSEIEKREGRKHIIKECNFDMEMIELFLKRYSKSRNPSRARKVYRELLEELISEKLELDTRNELLEEIEQLLSVA